MDESDSDRSQKLFRKVALARLSSPDRLDILLGISRPQTILAWIGAAILLGAFLFWGFTWPVEQKVVGRCILTSPSGIAEVTASAAGVVGGLSVKLGDRVAANQVIGRIVRSELDDQIRHARDRLAELERRREEITRINSRASSQGRSSASAERRLLEAQLRLAEDKASFMDFVLGHFVETQRDEFLATLAADPEFDFDIIELLVAEVETVVYADLPLGPSSDS